MAYKAFLDINILVDFIDKGRKEHSNAVLLFKAIAERRVTGYISESVVNTAYYLTQKLISLPQFVLFINDTLQILKVLPCTNAIITGASAIAKNDFEDAVLYQIALSNQLNFFITNDTKNYRKIAHPALKIVSAKELITLL